VAASTWYPLPADFAGMIDGPVYTATQDAQALPAIQEVNPEQLYQLWQQPVGVVPGTDPAYWALLPLPFVNTVGSMYALGFACVPSSPINMYYRYEQLPPDIADDSSTKYLPGGPQMWPLYQWAAVAEYEAQSHVAGVGTAMFNRLMQTAIDRDAGRQGLGQDTNSANLR
jgi:hypothetical protein